MAFDLDDEELEATRKLFSTPTDEKVLKNIIAEYDARVEDSKTYSVTVPVSRKETIAMSNLLKRVKELEEDNNYLKEQLKDMYDSFQELLEEQEE